MIKHAGREVCLKIKELDQSLISRIPIYGTEGGFQTGEVIEKSPSSGEKPVDKPGEAK